MADHQEDDQHETQYPTNFHCYKVLYELGNSVHKASCLPTKSMVAIKAIDLEQSTADCELKTMSFLSHPNIRTPYCSFTVDRKLWVVMTFMSYSVQSIISINFQNGLPELCISIILKEILKALSYFHNQGLIHGDIKGNNILMDSNGVVMLSDFGFSTSFYEPNSDSLAKVPYWVPPESTTIQNNGLSGINRFNIAHDIWAFGITALELAYGGPPPLSHSCSSFPKSLVSMIKKRFQYYDQKQIKELENKKNKKFSEIFKDMVASCLNQEPCRRPSAEQLLKHPFFSIKNLDFGCLETNEFLGIPNVEENLFNESRKERDQRDEQEKEAEMRTITGWKLNEDVFELDPIISTESDDQHRTRSAGKRTSS